jgi:hypothetical protein
LQGKKERKRKLENKNKQGEKNTLQGADIVTFIKFPQLRRCGHVERIGNQQIPKRIATFTVEGTRKRGRTRKKWTDNVEVDVNIMAIKTIRD